jgi:hypothetical protein
MKRKPLIAVVGHGTHAKKEHIKIAEEVGKEIAKREGIIICGGHNLGVMEAVAKGANSENGITIGIIPEDDPSKTSKYVDIPILTGIGLARNQIIALSCDVMIVIGGGVGSMVEAAYAYRFSKPIIVIKNLGSMVEQYVGKYMDDKRIVKIIGTDDAKEAVDTAFKLIKSE